MSEYSRSEETLRKLCSAIMTNNSLAKLFSSGSVGVPWLGLSLWAVLKSKNSSKRKQNFVCINRRMFKGKVVLVTGGASGIGLKTALEFAKEGGKIAIADINEDSGKNAVSQIESEGFICHFLCLRLLKEERRIL
jgi:hypothetical protein